MSSSLSQPPVLVAVLCLGVSPLALFVVARTLTPGVRGARRWGEVKISLCSSGAGIGGLDIGLVLSRYLDLLALGVSLAGRAVVTER